jgi:hypothetical protein
LKMETITSPEASGTAERLMVACSCGGTVSTKYERRFEPVVFVAIKMERVTGDLDRDLAARLVADQKPFPCSLETV